MDSTFSGMHGETENESKTEQNKTVLSFKFATKTQTRLHYKITLKLGCSVQGTERNESECNDFQMLC